MRVLIACEFSGTVRDAFAARGHQAMSCDLLPTVKPGLHYQGDVRHVLDGWMPVTFTADCDPDGNGWCRKLDRDPCDCSYVGPTMDDHEYREIDGELFGRPVSSPHWDLMIAHPPCTYLTVSGLHWNTRPGYEWRAEKTREGLDFVRLLMTAPIKRKCIENPVSCISSQIRKPDQIIQPYQFGHDASKKTCLWLEGLDPLNIDPARRFPGRIVHNRGQFVERWSNQTDSGQNRLGPSEDRWALRSITYQGIADAMASTWG